MASISKEIRKVTVIGAGTMGNGIAHVMAMHGYAVNLCDISEQSLTKAIEIIDKNLWRMVAKEKIDEERKNQTLNNITTFQNTELAVKNADLVIEAASENINVKQKIFETLDKYAPADCILASNTSSISITKIANSTRRPEKVIGMHFMNPVPVMKLVEVIKGYKTDEQTMNIILHLVEKIDKTSVVVNDFPGFVANRILLPMINEAIYTLYESVAGVEEIDQVMKLGMSHPMGPLELADFIGLDVCLSIIEVLQEGFGTDKYAPCPLLRTMVDAGNLGKKNGEGFYEYSQAGKIPARRFRKD